VQFHGIVGNGSSGNAAFFKDIHERHKRSARTESGLSDPELFFNG